jgi:hypothetical protein
MWCVAEDASVATPAVGPLKRGAGQPGRGFDWGNIFPQPMTKGKYHESDKQDGGGKHSAPTA